LTRLITRREAIAALAVREQRRGVAFHYAAHFTPRELAWYTRFEILVTGGILPPEITRTLKAGGTKVLAYEWSSAYYPGDWVSAAEQWQKRVKPEWRITPGPVGGGAAAPGKTAQWYDFGDPALIAARARYLASLLNVDGYDGFFFDTLGWEHLPFSVKEAFTLRHPKLDYNLCQGQFLAALRRELGPGKSIFTNQAFRHAAEMLPHADLDLSESYFTAENGEDTLFRPWHNAAKPWESIRTPMEQLVMTAQRKFPRVRFVHVNYAAPGEKHALLYGYAGAKLFNQEAYLMMPKDSEAEESGVYGMDLGRPLSTSYEQDETAGAAWRRFERGVAAIHSGKGEFTIPGTKFHMAESPRGYMFRSE
jgi:hypothetical protein